MFNINNPLKLSIFVSLIIFTLSIILVSLSVGTLLLSILITLFTFVVVFYVVKQFFYEKIRIIYKNIYKFKGTSNIKELDIDTVEKEAEEWAEAKEEELRQMKQDENYRREFIGNVSHELKTPIFNIQGYVQTLLDGGLQDDTINMKYLKRADKSVERMINIVEDLEVISRLETEQSELDIQTFDINKLVEEVFDQLEMRANEMKISLQLNNQSNSSKTLGDKDKIQQVLINLVSNSIKYGKKGGKTIIRILDMDDNILVEVADNGIGIDQVSLSRLFERFYRVDKNRSREIGGTGLGLAIVKHILEGHNQTISVRSTKGVGSTFSFILEKGK
ncbi:MAG: two-component sensor histidine kinase [Flavobacteriales bacterium]|nr:two-component sensor histidine kinase [Flavobacteriales bacterium]|tara:strand:- start:823 stop:1821 length:999 start_codon:yes stop_codon:yes gene_type:complete